MHNDPASLGNGSARAGSNLSQREALLELHPDDGALLRLSPTDIAQYIRLAQCRRYLRLRLLEQNTGTSFMRAWDAQPQSIPPLLTLSGRDFEAGAETEIGKHAHTSACSRDNRKARGIESDNQQLIDTVQNLLPGDREVVFQPMLRAALDGWELSGIADAIDFQRADDGRLSAFIIDFKSTTAARMEHRLQIAFYREMLDAILRPAGIECEIELGILYRGAPDDTAEPDDPKLLAQRDDALATFGVNGFLERIEDANALRRDVF
ncbi:MAG TPA: PD-(D/E)XK nuclease family protein, partial [Thermomicrobiales bacterium]|nr:PD-(D/E)XK nuclease family protein [Thermomicrobiales bacterium]